MTSRKKEPLIKILPFDKLALDAPHGYSWLNRYLINTPSHAMEKGAQAWSTSAA